MNGPCAEVIESSLHTFTAQCWRYDIMPPFGSLVTIASKGRTIFGLVHTIETGSIDRHHVPHAFQKTEAELLRDQPEIFAFLRTTFGCLTIGYQEQGTLRYQWAPEPPAIHAFVLQATQEQHRLFFSSEQYIQSLFSCAGQTKNFDELLLATVKQLSDKQIIARTHIEQFIYMFSLITGNDYRRLKLFLQRVAPCITMVTNDV